MEVLQVNGAFIWTTSAAQIAFEETYPLIEQRILEGKLAGRRNAELLEASTLELVLQRLIAIKQHYETIRASPELLSTITALSRRICYYSNVIDFLSLQSPKYASLAWASFTLLLEATLEHAAIASILLAALCDISNVLPKDDLSTITSPSRVLERTLGLIFAHVLSFFIRTLRWQEASTAQVRNPTSAVASFQYQDFIIAIQHETDVVHQNLDAPSQQPPTAFIAHSGLQAPAISKNITSFPAASGHTYGTIYISDQATVQLGDSYGRHDDVSGQLSALTILVQNMRDDLNRSAGLASSRHLDLGQAVLEDDRILVLDHISKKCLIDDRKTLSRLAVLCNQRPISARTRLAPFWLSPTLQDWDKSASSSYLFIKGTFRHRLMLRAFCVGIIQQLLSRNTPVLYVLCESDRSYDIQEVFKSLIIQLLRNDQCPDVGMHVRKLANAMNNSQYMSLIAEISEHFPIIYIILNAEAMAPDVAIMCRKTLRDLVCTIADRGQRTAVRILVTSQTPRHAVDRVVDDHFYMISNALLRPQQKAPNVPASGQKRPSNGHDLFAGLERGQKRRRRRR